MPWTWKFRHGLSTFEASICRICGLSHLYFWQAPNENAFVKPAHGVFERGLVVVGLRTWLLEIPGANSKHGGATVRLGDFPGTYWIPRYQ